MKLAQLHANRVHKIWTPAECKRYGWTKTKLPIFAPPYDGLLSVTDSTPIEEGWIVKEGIAAPLDELDIAKAGAKEAIRRARCAAEASGVTVNGLQIATDETSQSKIIGAALQAVVDPNYSCRWKTPGGFVSIAAEQITAIAMAVRAHVQACFDREDERVAAIDAAETIEAVKVVVWDAI